MVQVQNFLTRKMVFNIASKENPLGLKVGPLKSTLLWTTGFLVDELTIELRVFRFNPNWFFLRDHVKNIGYSEKTQNSNHLTWGISATFSITPDIPQSIWAEVDYRHAECSAIPMVQISQNNKVPNQNCNNNWSNDQINILLLSAVVI